MLDSVQYLKSKLEVPLEELLLHGLDDSLTFL